MKKSEMINAIESFSNLRVLVIGDIMLDVYDFCYASKSKELVSEKKASVLIWFRIL